MKAGQKTLFQFFFICVVLSGCHKQAAKIQPKLIVVVGSSTAAGTGAVPVDSSWVNKLAYQLERDKRNIQVINLAKGGYTTDKVLPSPSGSADTNRNITKALSYRPDLVIINLPTNDFDAGYTDEVILSNFTIITSAVVQAHVPFILTSTQPRDYPILRLRKRLKDFNELLAAQFSEQLVNVYDSLATPDFYINPLYAHGDGVHLNNEGHAVIMRLLMRCPVLKSVCY